MNRIFAILLTSAVSLMSFVARAEQTDASGHVLVSLWKSYSDAASKDRPQDELKILEKIKSEAAARKLAWDWYDAAQSYVDVKSSVNWKERRALSEALDKEVESVGMPVVYLTRFAGTKADWRWLEANKASLQKSYNRIFVRNNLFSVKFHDALPDLLSNDYEYGVWLLSMRGRDGDKILEKTFSGRYPLGALVEYTEISGNQEERKASLRKYADRYRGKAVSLLAEEDLVQYEFSELRWGKGKSEDFLRIRSECEAFEKQKSAFRGSEKAIADCCIQFKDVLGDLDSKAVNVSVKDNVATVAFRNTKSARLRISRDDSKGSVLRTIDVKNQGGRYYAFDTLKVDLPALDDGDYTVEAVYGNEKNWCSWPKYSISISSQVSADGLSIFAADYMTGRPLGSCQLVLEVEGKEAARAEIDPSSGFCPVPHKIVSKLNPTDWKNSLHVEARSETGLLLMSRDLASGRVSRSDVGKDEGSSVQRCRILTDRSAFNPGETVNFKAILYTGTYDYRLVPAGTRYTVSLYDSKGDKVETKSFRTNDFGSIAGSFVLKDDGRGGRYMIEVRKGSSIVASEWVRVDNFELPTFELIHKDDNRLYLPGETAEFSGMLKSYSGHALTSARASYTTSCGDGSETPFEIGADGSFSFSFKIPSDWKYGRVSVSIKVVDGTGESKDFNYSINASEPAVFRAWPSDVAGKVSGLVRGTCIVSSDDVKVSYSTYAHPSLGITYRLSRGGKTVLEGEAFRPGTAPDRGSFNLDMSGMPNDAYELVVTEKMVSEEGKTYTCDSRTTFVRVPDSMETFPIEDAVIFKRLEVEDGIGLQLVSTVGETWAVVELFGDGNKLLRHDLIRFDGTAEDCVRKFVFHREEGWPELLTLRALFFRRGECYEYNFYRKVESPRYQLPLSFTRFFDTTAPRGAYSILASTVPGVECAATIFDLTTESVELNRWYEARPAGHLVVYAVFNSNCGCNGSEGLYDGIPVIAYGASPRKSVMRLGAAKNSAVTMMADMASTEEVVVEEEPIPFQLAAPPVTAIRENFAKTVAWEPFLRSDKDGQLELKFTNADKLSTYVVQLFAHDMNMHNAAIRREMVVTIPVKLSISQPQILREGDRYVARVSLSNGLQEETRGAVTLNLFGGADRKTAPVLASKTYRASVPGSQSVTVDCPIDIPVSGVDTLGILAVFTPEGTGEGADAMFVSVPVMAGAQTITEAHSAILLAGEDRDSLVRKLESMFVNVPVSEISVRDISIRAMLSEALPDKIVSDSENSIGVAESLYADYIATGLGVSAMSPSERVLAFSRLNACRNTDGGFAWFRDMTSSMSVTAFLLQRNAAMGGTLLHNDAEAAVRYLDNQYFSAGSRPFWCGGISLGLYLYVRSQYSGVPFEPENVKPEDMRRFREEVRGYLVPSKARGLDGAVYEKARRLMTLKNLLAGGDLASRMAGISMKKISKSLADDVESLLQYAVKHDCGGYYYPNLVIPFRGLLESEASAHAMMCSLLDGLGSSRATEIAEGIRFWIMLQKETQQWTSDPGYLEALDAVFHGSESTLSTKVVVAETTMTLPFEEILAAGNGFTVERKWFVADREIGQGDTLRVGDHVRAEYHIWNKENRSFVRLTAPRPASMRPVVQLSGHYGWWMSPLRAGGLYRFSPQGYRSVRPDRTEYWFDSYPEENTTVTEEFIVSQEGEFRCPVVTIESLYAPHYRANDRGGCEIKSLYLLR